MPLSRIFESFTASRRDDAPAPSRRTRRAAPKHSEDPLDGDRLDWEARQLVRALHVPSPFDARAFLDEVEILVGSPIWLIDMPQAWRDFFAAVRMRVSGLVLPYANGHLILINREVVADPAVVIGHEVGHIVFGDVRRGEDPPLAPGTQPCPPGPTDVDSSGRPVLESLRQRTRICVADTATDAPVPGAGFGDPAESRAERIGTYIALAGTGRSEAVVEDAVTDYFKF